MKYVRRISEAGDGHVIEELEDSPNLAAEDAIRLAREDLLHHDRTKKAV